jgi:mitotic spindle assembly checkpoint protein MAD2B
MAGGVAASGEGGTRGRSQSDLRLDVITEFLEAATHHTLHARGVYPKELFEARAFYGARVQRSRHPDLDAYISDAVNALRRPIARGAVQRLVLVIKRGDSGGAGEPLERHVFDFALRPDYLSKTPTQDDVDALAKAFAACVSKISFLDSTLPPLPSVSAQKNGEDGITFELVAYANEPGVVRELGVDAWSEERVSSRDASDETQPTSSRFQTEPRMEFRSGGEKQTYPVKTTKTNLVDIDIFVEREKETRP